MSDAFMYYDIKLPYFWHLYNLTMFNERAIEIAIAHDWLRRVSNVNGGLEVGNVLGHYSQRHHMVVDLNEEPAWYQNQVVLHHDILDLSWNRPWKMFPWVCSISTIEHTERPIEALDNLMRLTDDREHLLVTFPTGVSDELDEWAVASSCDIFDRACTIARTEDGWEQTPEIEIRSYGPWADSVFVGEWMVAD